MARLRFRLSAADDRLSPIIGNARGVLATMKRDWRPQLSTASYHFDPCQVVVRVSTTQPRVKKRNLRRGIRWAR
jgi:uncharacterized protein